MLKYCEIIRERCRFREKEKAVLSHGRAALVRGRPAPFGCSARGAPQPGSSAMGALRRCRCGAQRCHNGTATGRVWGTGPRSTSFCNCGVCSQCAERNLFCSMEVPLQLREMCFYLSWCYAENENKERFFFGVRLIKYCTCLVTLNALHPEKRTNAYV